MKGFVYTLLAGVAIGMLIAPEKGSTMRARVSRWWDDINRQLSDLQGKAIDKIEDTAEVVDSRLQTHG